MNPLSKVWIYVSFKANQDYIATFLCINREKPEMGCHGVCHLSQQMQDAEEDDALPFPVDEKVKVDVFYISVMETFDAVFMVDLLLERIPAVNDHFPGNEFISGIFHPPQSLSQFHFS